MSGSNCGIQSQLENINENVEKINKKLLSIDIDCNGSVSVTCKCQCDCSNCSSANGCCDCGKSALNLSPAEVSALLKIARKQEKGQCGILKGDCDD